MHVALDSGIPLLSFEKYLETEVGATAFRKFGAVLHLTPRHMVIVPWRYSYSPLHLERKTNGIAHMWCLTFEIPDLARKLPVAQRNAMKECSSDILRRQLGNPIVKQRHDKIEGFLLRQNRDCDAGERMPV